MKVYIEGDRGEGKTLMAAVIAKSLHAYGYEVSAVVEVDGELGKEIERSTSILDSIRKAHLADAHHILHPDVKKLVEIFISNVGELERKVV